MSDSPLRGRWVPCQGYATKAEDEKGNMWDMVVSRDMSSLHTSAVTPTQKHSPPALLFESLVVEAVALTYPLPLLFLYTIMFHFVLFSFPS